jgi:hypothetical protein
LYNENQYPAWSIWNLDETQLSLNGKYSQKHVYSSTSNKPIIPIINDVEHITALVTINACGNTARPLLIVKGKNVPQITEDVRNEFAFVHQSNGWITTKIYDEYVEKILIPTINSLRKKKQQPNQRCIVFVDNHASHLSEKAKQLFHDNKIDYYSFPPHCTTILQPLDLGVFGDFKARLIKALYEYDFSNMSITDKRKILLQESYECLDAATCIKTCKSAFARCGLYPFSSKIPLESDLLVKKEVIIVDNDANQGKRKKITGGILLPTILANTVDNIATRNEEEEVFINFKKEDDYYYYFDE